MLISSLVICRKFFSRLEIRILCSPIRRRWYSYHNVTNLNWVVGTFLLWQVFRTLSALLKLAIRFSCSVISAHGFSLIAQDAVLSLCGVALP